MKMNFLTVKHTHISCKWCELDERWKWSRTNEMMLGILNWIQNTDRSRPFMSECVASLLHSKIQNQIFLVASTQSKSLSRCLSQKKKKMYYQMRLRFVKKKLDAYPFCSKRNKKKKKKKSKCLFCVRVVEEGKQSSQTRSVAPNSDGSSHSSFSWRWWRRWQWHK